MKNKNFTFEGNKYEVRCWLQDDSETYRIRVFFNKEPIGSSVDVKTEILNDAKSQNNEQDLLQELMYDTENMFKHQSLYLSNNSATNKEARC